MISRPQFSAVVQANPLVRMVGRDAPVRVVLADAVRRLSRDVVRFETVAPGEVGADYDYAQIDAALTITAATPPAADQPISEPAPGVGYSGLSPAQRWAFLQWLKTPDEPAPRAFQQLYLASLEVRLLEPEPMVTLSRRELLRLAAAPAWEARLLTPRLLLAFWLAQDGAELALWLAHAPKLDADSLETALGMVARLGQPLTAAMLPAVLAAWQLSAPDVPGSVLDLRLSSLAATLGAELLHYAIGPALAAPPFALWRCLHRDLRIAIPQDRLRGTVAPLLTDMLAQPTLPIPVAAGADMAPTSKGATALEKAHWIIEFRESRSSYFDWALRLAKRQPGFQQLMDEDRHIIYRAPFRRNETAKFRDLWTYVEGWANSRVFCQGKELDKSQVY
jgi:hypothetical protein